MERPPDSLKSLADRVARLACSGDATQLNQMLRLSGLMGGAARELDLQTGDMVVAPHNPNHLGIWERKIENGKVGAPLKGAMLIGNGPTDLHRISMIGNDLALDAGIGTCGKNGQGVPVGVGQPTLRMDRITVGGTG